MKISFPILGLAMLAAWGGMACSSDAARSDGQTQQPQSSEELGAAHAIQPFKELVVVHPTVVTDPVRTSNANRGLWSFRWLMEQLSGNQGINIATDFVENWLSTFHPYNNPDVPSGQLSDRPGVDDLRAKWPKISDGRIDLKQAPFRLLAIVNRADLGTSFGDFGEGRFVFGLVDPVTNEDLAMTVIFEYRLPGAPDSTGDDTSKRQLWSQRWHNLGNYAFGDPTYNQLLENITTAFAKHGGGSSIHQLRTNEIALSQNPMVHGRPDPSLVWELREWHLGDDSALHVANVKNTPSSAFNHDSQLAQFIVDNAATVTDGSIDFAQSSVGQSFLGFESHEQFDATKWTFDTTTPQVTGDLRAAFGMLTCNGCHNAEQSTLPPVLNGVGFYHVSPLVPPSGATDDTAGTERLSNFVKNIDIPRRQQFMTSQLGSATNLTGATNFDK